MVHEPDHQEPDSLRDIARWLTTPAACGVYLSALDLRRIGDRAGIQGLPVNRRFAVEQLFRAAAIEGKLGSLFDALIAEIEEQRVAYWDCDAPSLARWHALAGKTVTTLREMRHTSLSESPR